jgi:hypothetical protein
MIFINADNLDYPRYKGDVLLDPTANWQPVTEVPIPAVTDTALIAVEVKPIVVDNLWVQQFVIRAKTDNEIAESQRPIKLIVEHFTPSV